MENSEIVQVVTIILAAVVSVATLYQQYKMRQLERTIDSLRATIASVHALLLKDE